MDKQPSKPPVTSTQHTLPFSQLAPLRFEDLCLSVGQQKYGLGKIEHRGRAGTDGGADIIGSLELKGKSVKVAIQCKRYEKITPKKLIKALQEFCKHYPEYTGQFWIMTSATVSKKARDRFEVTVREKKLEPVLIDGSVLEADIRSLPGLMGQFFSTSPSLLEQSLHEAASKIIKKIQGFEREFLFERDRSFSGNNQLISERQKLMGQLLNTTMLDLTSETALLPSGREELLEVEKAAIAIINNYRTAGQTSEDGAPSFGSSVSTKALQEEPTKQAAFTSACERLRAYVKQYLHT